MIRSPPTAFFMQWPEGKHLLFTPNPYLEHSTSSKLPRLGQTAALRDLWGTLPAGGTASRTSVCSGKGLYARTGMPVEVFISLC